MSMLRKDMEDIKKIKMKLLKIKNIMSEVKNTLNGINRKLDTYGKKTDELEDTGMETTQFGMQREKKLKKQNKTVYHVLRNNLKWLHLQLESREEKVRGGESQKKNN